MRFPTPLIASLLGGLAATSACTPLAGGLPAYFAPGPGIAAPAHARSAEADDPASLRARVLTVGMPFELPRGRPESPITWRVADRDRHRVDFDGATVTPRAPGDLTMVAAFGGRRAWFQHAVRAVPPPVPGLHDLRLPEGPPAFTRPVVARDAATWARLHTLWWFRAAGPPVLDVRDGRFQPQNEAPHIDFRRHAVVVVDVRVGLESHPVFTHLAGDVVHLTIPGSWDEMGDEMLPPRFDTREEEERPSIAREGAFAFQIPQVKPGVRVALAAFPEAPARSWVSGEPELDVAPLIADLPPSVLIPAEIGP